MDVDLPTDEVVAFTCNICGHASQQVAGAFHREGPNCDGCGSTPRFRGIIHALSMALMKSSLPLSQFTPDRFIKGIGMSEWEVYAKVLQEKYDFTNTFFHQEPFLDITSESDWKNFENSDFLICTEVFEHVLQPLDIGFKNMRKMLKTGGHLIFSTPFTDAPATTEHFPGMVDFVTAQMGEEWLVVSKDAEDRYAVYDENIVFHGGPGTVLEMRIFGREELLGQLRDAGFEVEVFSQPIPEIGYYWPRVIDRPEIGYAGEHYIILCRAI